MSWTKLQLIKEAWAKTGYAHYVVDLQSEQIQTGLNLLEVMLANWAGIGIRIGYNLADNPDTADANDSSGLIDAANEPVIYNLAVRIAGSIGKQLSATDQAIARVGYLNLLNKAISRNTIPMQMPGELPVGAGNKYWRAPGSPFVQPPINNLSAGPDDDLEFK